LATFRTRRKGGGADGFTLVEVMIGMAIGLLAMLVMMQMLSFSENQKRVTAASGDAQNAGAIALYGIERDIQQSGYDVDAQQIMGCNATWLTSKDARYVTMPLAPFTINPVTNLGVLPSDANSDVVLVMYGSSSSPVEGDVISNSSGNNYTIGTPSMFNQNDYVIAQYAGRQHPCGLTLTKVTSATGSDPLTITAGTAVANITTTNSAAGFLPALYDLGATPTVRAYSVNNGSLTACDYMAYDCAHYAGTDTAHWVPIAANIVSLKAQYGRDTNTGSMNGIVDTYDMTTPPADTNAVVNSPVISCQWARISTARIALVAEGAVSGSTINAAEPTWDGSAAVAANGAIPATAANPINLATANPNWAKYHLKVFQTTVPIRNIISQFIPGTGYSGC
jgi:type IV pilus assembly protein PilW